jgi:hypothetical protein
VLPSYRLAGGSGYSTTLVLDGGCYAALKPGERRRRISLLLSLALPPGGWTPLQFTSFGPFACPCWRYLQQNQTTPNARTSRGGFMLNVSKDLAIQQLGQFTIGASELAMHNHAPLEHQSVLNVAEGEWRRLAAGEKNVGAGEGGAGAFLGTW